MFLLTHTITFLSAGPKHRQLQAGAAHSPPHREGITHGTPVRKAAILLLSAAVLCLPTSTLSSGGLLSAGLPWARLLLSCALLLLQDAPSVQDTARTESHRQRRTPPPKLTSFPGRKSAGGRQTSGKGFLSKKGCAQPKPSLQCLCSSCENQASCRAAQFRGWEPNETSALERASAPYAAPGKGSHSSAGFPSTR